MTIRAKFFMPKDLNLRSSLLFINEKAGSDSHLPRFFSVSASSTYYVFVGYGQLGALELAYLVAKRLWEDKGLDNRKWLS